MRALILGVVVSLVLAANASATIVADWTFETSPLGSTTPNSVGATYGPVSPEVGAGSASILHALATTVTTSPAGNGSVKSLSANMWSVNDYFQFLVNPTGTGMNALLLTFDQTGSATGPKNWKVATSPDGSTFTDVASYSLQTPALVFSAGTPQPAATMSFTLDPALLSSATTYVRLIDTSTTAINGTTVGTAGTGRVDNVIFNAVPEAPGALLGFAVCGMLGLVYGGRKLIGR